MRTFLFIFLACFTHAAFASWTNEVLAADDHFAPGRAIILYQPDRGSRTFKDALTELVKKGHSKRIETITLHWLVDDSAFQQEVFTSLERMAPRALAEAKRTGGKTPKWINALRKVLDEAVIATPTVKSINTELKAVGLQVSGASHEKLTLSIENGQPRFKCFLWLTVSPAKHP
jgi:hypothetical protein